VLEEGEGSMLGGILGLSSKTKNQRKKGIVEDGKGPSPPVLKAPVKQVRKWLSMTKDGEASSLELSKVRATQQLGIPLRDLRCVYLDRIRCFASCRAASEV